MDLIISTFFSSLGFVGLLSIALALGYGLLQRLNEALDQEKKNDRVLYERLIQAIDPITDQEKPKRDAYLVVGDDGELVEMDELLC